MAENTDVGELAPGGRIEVNQERIEAVVERRLGDYNPEERIRFYRDFLPLIKRKLYEPGAGPLNEEEVGEARGLFLRKLRIEEIDKQEPKLHYDASISLGAGPNSRVDVRIYSMPSGSKYADKDMFVHLMYGTEGEERGRLLDVGIARQSDRFGGQYD